MIHSFFVKSPNLASLFSRKDETPSAKSGVNEAAVIKAFSNSS